eukprot:CAMPEP_0178455138 /NCGR_PEP_ID=MMETSP0689_2-20121128/45743_1 /TAXON_ID=160604 /ORGANISM="Amphidinium massartii, Strain CS-259" /LENGTH=109 /DNA_ID=CAMNT_0020081141 /DNA_START=173 /DNA_END=499 /DNA_ORIENTATION=+
MSAQVSILPPSGMELVNTRLSPVTASCSPGTSLSGEHSTASSGDCFFEPSCSCCATSDGSNSFTAPAESAASSKSLTDVELGVEQSVTTPMAPFERAWYRILASTSCDW